MCVLFDGSYLKQFSLDTFSDLTPGASALCKTKRAESMLKQPMDHIDVITDTHVKNGDVTLNGKASQKRRAPEPFPAPGPDYGSSLKREPRAPKNELQADHSKVCQCPVHVHFFFQFLLTKFVKRPSV